MTALPIIAGLFGGIVALIGLWLIRQADEVLDATGCQEIEEPKEEMRK